MRRRVSLRSLPRPFAALRSRLELAGLSSEPVGPSINGWANTYHAAAVRSMTTSWHGFLFTSLDKTGLMTVDKPPLALWVQTLSARVFGLDSLSIVIPQALMGVAAVSRHNNPDELLVLCCVAALWFTARALETGQTKWLVGHAGADRSWMVARLRALLGSPLAIAGARSSGSLHSR